MGNRSSSPKAHRKTASPQLASDARAAKTNAEVWAARSTAGAVFICVAAALLRLPGISRDFPALTDEAIYLRWAEIIVHQNQWFVSLLDGKQPLSYWLYALIRFASDTDPLLAARAVSLLAGALTALLIYAIGKRLGGPVAGLAGALCWSVFPWSMVYDRLAFTEALVNLAGACIVYTSVLCFEETQFNWRKTLALAASFGLAILVKSTTLLFLFVPVLIGLWSARRPAGVLLARWAAILGAAALVVVFLRAATPKAPTHATHDVLLHHTSRFTGLSELGMDPLVNARENFPQLADDLLHYLPLPALLFALGCFLYLVAQTSTGAIIVIAASILPVTFQVFVLSFFTTRFVYPHMWPWMLAMGLVIAEISRAWQDRAVVRARLALLIAGAVLSTGSMAVLSFRILSDPKSAIEPDDSGRFFGSYVHVAWGVPEALDFLVSEAKRDGGFVLLTDPVWGVPADMAFAYLNQRHGISVHEAWWLQTEDQPSRIMPNGEVEVVKSHYERVAAGTVDFRKIERVYYLTDSFYMPQATVRSRQPNATLLNSFRKPEGSESVDVYRLK